MKSARWFVLFGICLALIACQAVDHHSGATGHQPAADDDADDDSIVDDDCASPHQFLYELSPGKRDIPFPSDLFTRADMSSSTGRRVEMDGQTTLFLDRLLDVFGFLRSALDRLEGFGVTTPVMLPADSEPDMATLPGAADPGPQDSVFLVRFDDSGAPLEYAPLVFEWRQTQQVLVARPYLALLQNTTYALVVTDALKPADGTCYEPAEDFRYVRAGRPDATHPGYALLEPYRRQFASLFDFLENRAGVPRERVLVATVFTTQNVTPELESIRDQLKVRAAKEPPTARNWTYVGTGTDLDSIWEFDYDTVNWQWDGELHHDVRCRPVSNGGPSLLSC